MGAGLGDKMASWTPTLTPRNSELQSRPQQILLPLLHSRSWISPLLASEPTLRPKGFHELSLPSQETSILQDDQHLGVEDQQILHPCLVTGHSVNCVLEHKGYMVESLLDP